VKAGDGGDGYTLVFVTRNLSTAAAAAVTAAMKKQCYFVASRSQYHAIVLSRYQKGTRG